MHEALFLIANKLPGTDPNFNKQQEKNIWFGLFPLRWKYQKHLRLRMKVPPKDKPNIMHTWYQDLERVRS